MFNTAKHVKTRCANARRTATAVKELSNNATLDIADRGLLLKAAQVIGGMAERMATEAKTLKAKEVAYERAIKTATADAVRLFKLWPAQSTVDKVSIIAANGEIDRLNSSLRRERDAKGAQWSLSYHTDEACRQIPNAIAYQAVTKKLTVDVIETAMHQKYEAARGSTEIARLAASIDALLTPAAEAA